MVMYYVFVQPNINPIRHESTTVVVLANENIQKNCHRLHIVWGELRLALTNFASFVTQREDNGALTNVV